MFVFLLSFSTGRCVRSRIVPSLNNARTMGKVAHVKPFPLRVLTLVTRPVGFSNDAMQRCQPEVTRRAVLKRQGDVRKCNQGSSGNVDYQGGSLNGCGRRA